ncbi:MAG TPA: XVIPCD domain-containing protein [Lysobacter sp.]|nr:XVIPCD domain-containing protein [Lysobacter sp.]
MPFDQQRYEQLRANLVDRNEANVGNVYLDVLGIPTVGIGVALTARQADRTMALDANHVTALGDVLNLDARQRQQLTGLLQSHLTTQNQHIDERHNSLRDFLASDFGQSSQRVFGTLVNTRHVSPSGAAYSWDVLTSADSPMQVQLTHEQSIALFNRVAPEYEGRLNNTLRRAQCPPEALSEEQRAALFSMVYQGASGKARRTADAIGDYWRGELTEDQLRARLRTAVNDPAFPERSRNELDFLQNIEPRPARTQAAGNALPAHGPVPPDLQGATRPPFNRAADPQRPNDAERQNMIDRDRPRGNDLHIGRPDESADPLYRQAEAAVRRLDESMGKAYDSHSACMAASLARLARENGVQRIDHVVLSEAVGNVRKGENVFIVQGGMAEATNRVFHMKTQDAISTPVEQSLARMQAVSPAQAVDGPRQEAEAQARQATHRMTV